LVEVAEEVEEAEEVVEEEEVVEAEADKEKVDNLFHTHSFL
jgi:hypothetical protein